jgi:hypothetical protein
LVENQPKVKMMTKGKNHDEGWKWSQREKLMTKGENDDQG